MKDTPSAQTLNNTGACAVVNGPSGSGKSLFLRTIADLDPNEGKVFLGDLPRASMPATRWPRNVVYQSAEEPGDWCIARLFALGFGAVGML